MKTLKTSALGLLLLIGLSSCSKKETTTTLSDSVPVSNAAASDSATKPEETAAAESTNESAIIDKIKGYIKNTLLTEADLRVIQDSDRKFKMAQTDLNGDGKNETFVYFNSDYFRGSGGGTVLLFSPEGELITKFTPMKLPIYIENTANNNWKSLVVSVSGKWKKLSYANDKYPSNPSMVAVEVDAPDKGDTVLFDNLDALKEYGF